nr:hypothetical protein [Tanacetum cinerariifolium]
TDISSPFEELSDIGSPRADDHEHFELPEMLEDPYIEVALQAPASLDYVPGPEHADDEIVAEDQPYAENASPIAQSPEYVLESNFKAHLEDDDYEDPEEDPLPSASHRENKPEVTLPPQKRLGIALGPRYEVGESSSAAAARPAGGFRADYGFVATMDREIMRDPEREVGYWITDSWDEFVETLMSREAWVRSTDASDLVHGEVMSLPTTTEIRELQAADRRRQTVILELLRIDHRRSTEISELRT